MAFIAFEVFVDGQRIASAGDPSLEVLTATLVSGRAAPRKGHPREPYIELRVGGLSKRTPDGTSEFLDWVALRKLEIGSEVTFKIVSTSAAEPPAERRRNP